LVGEGKKYATVEDLAKGAVNAQFHIGTLEQETATLREQSGNNKGVEEVLAAIRGIQQPGAQLSEQQQVALLDQQTQQPKELTVAEQVAAAFSARDTQVIADTQAGNRATLIKQLGETYGVGASALYEQVGNDLGIDLDELAGKSPAAVMKLIADARPAPAANISQALPGGMNIPQQQLAAQSGVLNKSAIGVMFAAGKITMTQKHEMENRQLTLLGSNAFYK
jgi:hypothetical protein